MKIVNLTNKQKSVGYKGRENLEEKKGGLKKELAFAERQCHPMH